MYGISAQDVKNRGFPLHGRVVGCVSVKKLGKSSLQGHTAMYTTV